MGECKDGQPESEEKLMVPDPGVKAECGALSPRELTGTVEDLGSRACWAMLEILLLFPPESFFFRVMGIKRKLYYLSTLSIIVCHMSWFPVMVLSGLILCYQPSFGSEDVAKFETKEEGRLEVGVAG